LNRKRVISTKRRQPGYCYKKVKVGLGGHGVKSPIEYHVESPVMVIE
jgi:hypothetical protein